MSKSEWDKSARKYLHVNCTYIAPYNIRTQSFDDEHLRMSTLKCVLLKLNACEGENDEGRSYQGEARAK